MFAKEIALTLSDALASPVKVNSDNEQYFRDQVSGSATE